MSKRYIQKGGYYDTPLWAKRKLEDGTVEKIMCFPVTRYDNIIGKPAVVSNVNDIIGIPEFSLLKTQELEIPDDEIFGRANQSW